MVTVVAATVQSSVTNDAAHSSIEMFGESGNAASTSTVRVDVAVVSEDVAAEKDTTVVPESSTRSNAQFPISSVVVVASVESYAAVTTETADVVPVNVTLVVAKSSFSLGESIERESAGNEGDGLLPLPDEVSAFCVGLPPLAPPEMMEIVSPSSLPTEGGGSCSVGSSTGDTEAPRTCGADCGGLVVLTGDAVGFVETVFCGGGASATASAAAPACPTLSARSSSTSLCSRLEP